MSTIPRENDAAVAWCAAHLPIWIDNAASIGLDPAELADLSTLISEANTRLTARDQAKDAASGAVGTFNEAAGTMRELAALQVAKIRTFAKGSDTPAIVYEDAQIPAPADPTPRPAPGTPTLFTITLEQSGALQVDFKCPNPPRVGALTYRVERSIGAQQPFVFLLNAKERSFTDGTVPSGSGDVTYRVTAQSSTKDGAPGYFTVRFGVNQQAEPQAEIVSEGTSSSKAS
ncbi:MAG: hypothetical protein RIE77_10675 [Phycisphaerales bacterium]|jgi:hypothetical protein